MKILIGTPIHVCKDYSMERWLENVANLIKVYPADILLVDNSPGLEYVEKVREYCKKYGITNYVIEHIEIHQENGAAERIGRSREIIRQYFLKKDYGAWFTWECDQIIPNDALGKLVQIMKDGDFNLVSHNSWARGMPAGTVMASFGCCLVRRDSLEKYGFLLEYPGMPRSWFGGEVWFKKQVLNGGGSYIEVYGVIDPIYHLDNKE